MVTTVGKYNIDKALKHLNNGRNNLTDYRGIDDDLDHAIDKLGQVINRLLNIKYGRGIYLDIGE